MRNIGGDAVKLRGLYVFRPGSLNALCSLPVPGFPTIGPGDYRSISNINVDRCSIERGNDYVIKVVSQKGTEFAITVTAS